MAADLQRLIEEAARSQSELFEWLDPLERDVYQRWVQEAGDAAQFLAQVLQNNPDKPLADILRRPDVQLALRTPFLEASRNAEEKVNEAWLRGREQGLDDAESELSSMGIEPPGRPRVPTETRDRIIEDVRRHGRNAASDFRAALDDPDPATSLDRVVRRYANRSALSVNTSGRFAHSAGKEAMYRLGQRVFGRSIQKLWVTSFSSTTCPMCASLHGTRRRLGEPFPVESTLARTPVLRSYGALNHPPRHPNCRCRVILSLPQFEASRLSTMVEAGRRWWHDRQRRRV